MSTVHHYKSNLRDIFFNLFELHDTGNQVLGRGPFASMDEETAREALKELEKLCVAEIASSFAEADREGLHFDGKGNVTLPACLKRSLKAYFDADWDRFDIPEHLGGVGASRSMSWGGFELLAGANPSMTFYLFGPLSVRVLDRLATPEQKRRFLPGIIERHWGGSMVLTEPDAGSDVGAGRTKARHIQDDIWEVEGVKRFITNGDFDFAENIVHLVLARPEGAAPGTKGLSMFIVPKYWVNEDGSLGERNGVVCTNVEKKMGISASATCEMTFGGGRPARGLLVGGQHNGIHQMFHVIEQARMAVGIKSMATVSTAYLNALEFAKIRVQGPDLMQAANKLAPRVRIIQHPDVRRMLLNLKAHAEGMRALCIYTAVMQDHVELNGGHGAAAAAPWDHRNDLLLPLVKGYCSDRGWGLLADALQVFGGSGFIKDYPMEQYIRDQKIDSLYEGTTHIQALDLFFRKIARDGGETLQALLAEVRDTAGNGLPGEALRVEREALALALDELDAIFGLMLTKVGESLYHAGLQANRVLHALSEVLIGWLLFRQAAIALKKLESHPQDADFHRGKLASARYWARNVLPQVGFTRRLIEDGTLEIMDMPESAF
ncbi:MAG: Butyryl-CoA dehydrogenase [Myxococcota bacterium]|nr:Butyryl-CoA dehydrogenase [Myxococcota bacterium]